MSEPSPTALAHVVRRTIVDASMRAGVGHIGSALSVADIVAAVYADLLRATGPNDPERDRFVLSKGHAVLALYAALAATGRIDPALLETYCGDGSLLGTHPEHALPWIDFSTGSLGQGLSLAAGAALAGRWQRSPRRAFALLSDAECDEGAIWEAAMFAAHHRLSNLVAIVDVNEQQALGYTRDVLDLSPLAARWTAFGWHPVELDGHDADAIAGTIRALDTRTGPPHVLLAQTTFGNGVSFMHGKIEWHYRPLTPELHARAVAELEAAVPA